MALSGEQALQKVSESNANFSRDFYKVLKKHEGNLVASPLSAQLVLVMAQLGAGGGTAEEMRRALCIPEDVEIVKKGFHSLTAALTNSERVILEIANRMYVKTGFDVKPEFSSALQETFNSSVESVNFADPAVKVAINSWVAKTTHHKIKDLIPDGVLDSLTRLVLVNAVYFKGPWVSPFDKANTRPMPFYTDETVSVDTPFMYQKANYGYTKLDDLDAQLVEMPYEGRRLSLVIILPNKRTGLAELEQKMESQDLSTLMQTAYSRELELHIPKFKLEVTLKLNDYLTEMGMKTMFSEGANFSGISDVPLCVSHVLQKTFIEVSEEGTEAAAATGAVIRKKRSAPLDQVVVTADRPFLFYLVHRTSQNHMPLFVGRLTKLTAGLVKDEL